MTLSVLYGCDNNYAPYTGVSMTSLFENNKEIENITVYLAALQFSQENIDKFNQLASRYNRTLIYLEADEAIQKITEYNCATWNGSLAAWLRFFVLDQIPDNVEHLIWIDSDTIVYSGIENMVDFVSNDIPIAAAYDCISYQERFRLGLKWDDPYFNSGVILFNMKYWRSNNTQEMMLRHLQKNVNRYSIPDQDMMNDFFYGAISTLPARFNSQCFLWAYTINDYFMVYPWTKDVYYSKEAVSESITSPVIVHFFRFLGDYPWTQGNNFHPAKGLYNKWKEKSLWKDHEGAPAKKDAVFRMEKLLYRILPRKVFLRLFAWYTNRKLPKEPMG